MNGNLSWSLALNYGSKEWRVDDDGTCLDDDDLWVVANPSWVSAGWSLHFGAMLEPVDPCGAVLRPTFASTDGAMHELYPVAGSTQDFISRDSSFIRAWKYPGGPTNGGGWKVYLADGSILDLRHHVDSDDERVKGWYTTLMVDTWGNRLDIEYHAAPHAQALSRVVDAHGRVAKFDLWSDEPSTPEWKRGKLKELRYPVFGDDPADPTGLVTLDYEERVITMPTSYMNPYPALPSSQALLTELRFPEGATWRYTYSEVGEITSITYPTGAVSSYACDYYLWMVRGPGRPEDVGPIEYAREQGRGVTEHSLDLDGNPATTDDDATWTYDRPSPGLYILDVNNRYGPAPFAVSVVDPDENAARHVFAGYHVLDPYGSHLRSPTHLLVRKDEILRSTEQKWEIDAAGDYTDAGFNSRVSWSRTVNTEDGSWREESNCGSDGLGHFRVTRTREQSFRETAVMTATDRATVTDWVPILCQWILGTRARVEVAEGGQAAVTRFRHGIRGELLESVSEDRFVVADPIGATCDGSGDPFIRVSGAASAIEPLLVSQRPSTADLTANPYPAPPGACLPPVFAGSLAAASGDVRTGNTWFGPVTATGDDWRDELGFPSAGNLRTTTTSGADSAATFAREFRWLHGAARWAQWTGMPWKLFEDEIDPASGLRAASTDSAGFRTEYHFDALGRIRSITPGPSTTDGGVTVEAPTRINYTFSPPTADVDKGFPLASPVEHSQEYWSYDTLGRLIRHDRRDADSSIVSRVTRWSPSGPKLAESEWVDTDQVESRGPLPPIIPETTFSYARTLPGGATGVDPYHRVHVTTFPDGAIAEADYHGLRETRRVRGINGDPDQVSETRLYSDMLGRLGYVDAPVGSTDASYQYDIHDKMRRASLDGQLRLWTRDALGRLETETQPESGTTTFPVGLAYDALGNPIRRFDADGRELLMTYDAAGRLLTTSVIEQPGQPTTLLTTLTYDQADRGTYAAGKLTRSEQRNCLDGTCETIARDQYWTGLSGRLGRLRQSQPTCGLVLEARVEHDALGLETVRRLPEIVSSTCAAEGLPWGRSIVTSTQHGLPTALGEPEAATKYVKLIAYAPSGAPRHVGLDNGSIETTTFDARSRTARIRVTRGQSTVFDTGEYAYDGASNILSFGPTAERALPQTFAYDLVGRLTTATLPGVGTFMHSYDPWGNMTSSTLSHGGEPECVPGGFFGWGQFTNRQYLRGQDGTLSSITTNRTSALGSPCFPAATIAHDNAGRVLHDERSTYSWDAQDRLLRRQRLDTSEIERHAFDASGYRASTESSTGERTVEFRGPDGELWRSFRVSSAPGTIALDRDSIRLGSRVVAVVEHPGAAVVWHHADHLGSTRATTLADGTRRDRFEYSPFGLDLPDAGGALPGADRDFATHERDGDGTLDYMMARWMSASAGRFMSVDPARGSVRASSPTSWNRFDYSRGNPVNTVDPDGRDARKRFNAETGVVTVTLRVDFSGSGAQRLHDSTKAGLEQMFNGARTAYKGREVDVRVRLDSKVSEGVTPGAPLFHPAATGGRSLVVATPDEMRVITNETFPSVNALSGGVALLDPVASPLQAAHEAGHLMGLPHVERSFMSNPHGTGGGATEGSMYDFPHMTDEVLQQLLAVVPDAKVDPAAKPKAEK